MLCAICGGATQVERSRASDTRVVRRRVCVENPDHRFETIEQVAGSDLGSVLVRRTGDGQLTKRGIDSDLLLRNVRRATLKRLDEAVAQRVVDGALRTLAANLPRVGHPIKADEREQHPGYETWVHDADIRNFVERQLRLEQDSISHVLYAMSVLARSDREGRSGWQGAEDVLTWMDREDNYPDLSAPVRSNRDLVSTDTWQPVGHAPRPSRVIKKNGQRRTFRAAQFAESIEDALMGRPDSRQAARYILEWVLWGLAGQDEVLTSQLAVGTMDCLRRVDDIAYLRWTTIAKNFDSVIDFRSEAVGLIQQPSPRLMLDFLSPRFRRPAD